MVRTTTSPDDSNKNDPPQKEKGKPASTPPTIVVQVTNPESTHNLSPISDLKNSADLKKLTRICEGFRHSRSNANPLPPVSTRKVTRSKPKTRRSRWRWEWLMLLKLSTDQRHQLWTYPLTPEQASTLSSDDKTRILYTSSFYQILKHTTKVLIQLINHHSICTTLLSPPVKENQKPNPNIPISIHVVSRLHAHPWVF